MSAKLRTAKFIGLNSTLFIANVILGLGVQICMANYLGATEDMDIFFAVIGLTAGITVVVCSTLPQTYVPLLKEIELERSDETLFRITGVMATWLFVFFFICAAVIAYWADNLVFFLVPGFEPDSQKFTAGILRIIVFAIVLDSLRALTTSYYYSRERFGVPGIAPSIHYLVLIFTIVFIYPVYGLEGIAYGWLIGSSIMLLLHVVMIAFPMKGPLKWRPFLWDKRLVQMLGLITPVLLIALADEIRIPIERVLASHLGEGSISYLGYSNKIIQTMYGVLPMAIALTYFPQFSLYSATKDFLSLKRKYTESLRIMIFVIIPMTVIVVMLHLPIIHFLFERGAFTHSTTVAVANSLLAYTGLFVGGALSALTYNVFYSLKKPGCLIKIELTCLPTLVLIDLIFIKWWGYLGIALGASFVAIMRALASIRALRKRLDGLEDALIFNALKAGGGAGLTMGAVMMIAKVFFEVRDPTTISLLLYLICQIIIGSAVYLCSLYLMKMPELIKTMSFMKSKFAEKA